MPKAMTPADKQAAIQEFNAAVATEVSTKRIHKIQAAKNVACKNPALHAKFLQATNKPHMAESIAESAADFGVGLD